MEAFYFNSNGRRLYAAYHPPDNEDSINTRRGVVICHPFGQEYIRCHKIFIRLAETLSANNFHTLRFDFTACGDSEGDIQSVQLDTWLEDIHYAINELCEGSNLDAVYLVGARFGATLAYLYAGEFDIDGIVALSPIVSGEQYILEMQQEHEKYIGGSFARMPAGQRSGIMHREVEVMGYVIPEILINQIKSVDLKDTKHDLKSSILFIGKSKNIPLALNGKNCFKTLINDHFWSKGDEFNMDRKVIPSEEIEIINNWLCEK